jgi:uncharacterized coiled-coil DUF342 family protein
VVWDRLRARLDECAREIEELSAMFKEHKNKRRNAESCRQERSGEAQKPP